MPRYLETVHGSEVMMRGRDPDAILNRRWWPTVEMLEAGIDLLTAEWDVAAIRAGVVSRPEIAEPAFHFFGPCSTRIPASSRSDMWSR